MNLHVMRPLDRSSYPDDAEVYAPELLSVWLRHFPDAEPTQRDKEDWVENAVFLQAFERTGVPFRVLGKNSGAFISSISDTLATGQGEKAFFHTGISGRDHVEAPQDLSFELQLPSHLSTIPRHAELKTFKAAAGRDILFAAPEKDWIDEAIRTLVPGAGQFFIKTLKKEWAQRFEIEAGRSPWDQMCEAQEGLEWSIIHLDGVDQPYFSIQGIIEPWHEYRMFMVDHQPVTGAGCVEAFTPLDNETTFDPKTERVRNSGDIETRPDLVDMFKGYAEKFGAALRNEIGPLPAYSLDLCVNALTGKIVPIELNPPLNLGRYASDVDAWVRAIDRQLGEAA